MATHHGAGCRGEGKTCQVASLPAWDLPWWDPLCPTPTSACGWIKAGSGHRWCLPSLLPCLPAHRMGSCASSLRGLLLWESRPHHYYLHHATFSTPGLCAFSPPMCGGQAVLPLACAVEHRCAYAHAHLLLRTRTAKAPPPPHTLRAGTHTRQWQKPTHTLPWAGATHIYTGT